MSGLKNIRVIWHHLFVLLFPKFFFFPRARGALLYCTRRRNSMVLGRPNYGLDGRLNEKTICPWLFDGCYLCGTNIIHVILCRACPTYSDGANQVVNFPCLLRKWKCTSKTHAQQQWRTHFQTQAPPQRAAARGSRCMYPSFSSSHTVSNKKYRVVRGRHHRFSKWVCWS